MKIGELLFFRSTIILPLDISEQELKNRVSSYPLKPGEFKKVNYALKGFLIQEEAPGLYKVIREAGRGSSRIGFLKAVQYNGATVAQVEIRLDRTTLGLSLVFMILCLFSEVNLFVTRDGHGVHVGLVLLLFIYLFTVIPFISSARKLEKWLQSGLLKP